MAVILGLRPRSRYSESGPGAVTQVQSQTDGQQDAPISVIATFLPITCKRTGEAIGLDGRVWDLLAVLNRGGEWQLL